MLTNEETDSSTTKPSKATVYLEWTLLVTNIVLLCFAWTILGVAVAFVAQQEFGIIRQADLGLNSYINGCHTSIAIGVLLVVTSSLQFGGYACTKEGVHIWIRGASILLVIVIEVLEVASLAWLFGTTDNGLDQKLKTMMLEDSFNDRMREMRDHIQIRLHCCGAESRDDYSGGLPRSCHHHQGEIFETGCTEALWNYVSKRTDVLEGLLCMTLLLEVTWFAATVWACHIQKKARVSVNSSGRHGDSVHYQNQAMSKDEQTTEKGGDTEDREYATLSEVSSDYATLSEVSTDLQGNDVHHQEPLEPSLDKQGTLRLGDQINYVRELPSAPMYASVDRRTKSRARNMQDKIPDTPDVVASDRPQATEDSADNEYPESPVYAVLEVKNQPEIPLKMINPEQKEEPHSISDSSHSQHYNEMYVSGTVFL